MSENNQPFSVSSGYHRMVGARTMLESRDLIAVAAWAVQARNPMRTLTRLLFDNKSLIRWRAIEAMGIVAGVESHKSLERVRRQIRRLFWLMNDESGGLCWHAPEAIGEIIYNVPELIDEFGTLLPSFFHEEPFEHGSRLAVARVARLKPGIFSNAVEELRHTLDHDDPAMRGYSILALRAIGDRVDIARAKKLSDDDSYISLYDHQTGQLTKTSIAQLANRPSD